MRALSEEKCVQGFGGKTLKEGDHLEDIDIDGNMLEWILTLETASSVPA